MAIVFLTVIFSTIVTAETCTAVIRDEQGFNYDTYTRSSGSFNLACDEALTACDQELSYYHSFGYYYDATCTIKATTLVNRAP